MRIARIYRAHQLHAAGLRVARRPKVQAENYQGDHQQGYLQVGLASGTEFTLCFSNNLYYYL